MAEEFDVATETSDSPRGWQRWVRWLIGVGVLLILLSCAGIYAGFYWIQTEQGREVRAILAIFNHGRCVAEAAEVQVGWSYDQLWNRFGNRLSQTAEDDLFSMTTAPPSWPKGTSGKVQVMCRRPNSQTDSWCGTRTHFVYGLDAQGNVVSVEQSVTSWCE